MPGPPRIGQRRFTFGYGNIVQCGEIVGDLANAALVRFGAAGQLVEFPARLEVSVICWMEKTENLEVVSEDDRGGGGSLFSIVLR